MKRKYMIIGLAIAMSVTLGIYDGQLTQYAHAQVHPDRDKFHADIAHALLEMNTTLDLIGAYRVEGQMPPDRDEKHEKAAHGFKQALELFGIKISM